MSTAPRWSRAEHTRLEVLLESGHSYTAAAAKLRRTPGAVRIKAGRRGIARERRTTTLGTLAVERLLGITSRRTVVDWIGRGWMKAHNISNGTRPTWRITEDALLDFLESAAYDFAWSPATMTDPDLRAWATRIRTTHPRWLTTTEVAARCGVTPRIVARWCREGRLAATRYKDWFICETALREFVAPGERP